MSSNIRRVKNKIKKGEKLNRLDNIVLLINKLDNLINKYESLNFKSEEEIKIIEYILKSKQEAVEDYKSIMGNHKGIIGKAVRKSLIPNIVHK